MRLQSSLAAVELLIFPGPLYWFPVLLLTQRKSSLSTLPRPLCGSSSEAISAIDRHAERSCPPSALSSPNLPYPFFCLDMSPLCRAKTPARSDEGDVATLQGDTGRQCSA